MGLDQVEFPIFADYPDVQVLQEGELATVKVGEHTLSCLGMELEMSLAFDSSVSAEHVRDSLKELEQRFITKLPASGNLVLTTRTRNWKTLLIRRADKKEILSCYAIISVMYISNP